MVNDFVAAVKRAGPGAELSGALNPAQQIIKIVNEELIPILGGETRLLRFAKRPPTVIMLAGLQGSGKTTLAGKLALWLKDQGHSPLLVAADLQRPERGQPAAGRRPARRRPRLRARARQRGRATPVPGRRALDRRGRAPAVRRGHRRHRRPAGHRRRADAAGRGHPRRGQPDEVLFVVDAMIGQDAVNTANAFADGVGFDGVVLTKLDGDARGGAALSIARVTGRPIMFASNGEALKDFDVFHPDRMASRILGMGDMLTLIEQAEQTFDADQSAKAAAKLASKEGKEFGLADFLQQMQMVRKMGPLSKIFGMLPGMGEIKDQISNIDERDVDRIEAIIHSMTPAERDNPKIIDGSRRARIARGAGVEVTDVNGLVNRFFDARKMMSSLAGGKMPGHAGDARDADQRGSRRQAAEEEGRPRRLGQSGQAQRARAGAAGRRPGRRLRGRPESTRPLQKAMAEFELPPELRDRFGQLGPSELTARRRATAPQRRGAARRRAPGPVGRGRGAAYRAGGGRPDRRDQPLADAWPGRCALPCRAGGPRRRPRRPGRRARAGRPRGGALLLRDAGSPADTRWMDDRPDLPRLIRAGRHIARPKRYLRNFGAEVEPDELVAEVERQAARSDGWIKLVGDWIDREIGDLSPLWPVEARSGPRSPGPTSSAAG